MVWLDVGVVVAVDVGRAVAVVVVGVGVVVCDGGGDVDVVRLVAGRERQQHDAQELNK